MRGNLLPELVAFPASVIMIDRAPRREVCGQVPPLAGGAHDIEHRVEQFALGVLARASRLAGLGETVVNELPFGVCQVMSVAHPQLLRNSPPRIQLFLNLSSFSNRLLEAFDSKAVTADSSRSQVRKHVQSAGCMNWQSFAELAFSFTLNPAIVAKSLGFALFMGLLGGFLPAVRASRLNIVDALRAA